LAGLRLYYGGMAIGQETPDAFKQSLDIDPQDFNAQYYLKEIVKVQGEQMLRWEQLDDGVKILLDALRYLPDDPDLLLILRDTYQAQGKDAPAREISQRLSEIVDVHPE
jgi:tetratricopeptide (TPR) repeat protein